MGKINNLLIEKTKEIVMFNSDGSVRWSAQDVSTPKITVTSEAQEKLDAMQNVVSKLFRGKKADIEFTTAFFSLDIQAAQSGTTVKEFSTDAPVTVRWRDEVKVGGTASSPSTTITLTNVPVGETGSEVSHIYIKNADNSLGKRFSVGSEADATHFTVSASSKTITLPVGADIKDSDIVVVYYDYAATAGASVTNTSTSESDAGRLCLFVQFKDICNEEVKYSGVVEFPSAQVAPDCEIGLAFDDTYTVQLSANKKYCSSADELFTTYIPE